MITVSAARAASAGDPRGLGTRRDKTTNGLVVAIVDDDVEPGVDEARREVPTQAPDADEADPHQPTTGASSGMRCRSSPS